MTKYCVYDEHPIAGELYNAEHLIAGQDLYG